MRRRCTRRRILFWRPLSRDEGRERRATIGSMHRVLIGALTLVVCCRPHETPAAPAPTETKAVSSAPAPPHAWRVTLLRSGGFGGGMTFIALDSTHPTPRCGAQQQAMVAAAVAAARPAAWAPGYPDTSGGMTDQFHDRLTLQADDAKYESSWSSGSGGIPPDLARLRDAILRCR